MLFTTKIDPNSRRQVFRKYTPKFVPIRTPRTEPIKIPTPGISLRPDRPLKKMDSDSEGSSSGISSSCSSRGSFSRSSDSTRSSDTNSSSASSSSPLLDLDKLSSVEPVLTQVCKLDFSNPAIAQIPRGGCIFYTFTKNSSKGVPELEKSPLRSNAECLKLHVCMGVDSRTGDITDFAGQRKKGESLLQCVVREGNEESRNSFGEIREDQISAFQCIWNPSMLIVFIPVISIHRKDIRSSTIHNFQAKKYLTEKQAKSRCYNEISGIRWFSEPEVEDIFSETPKVVMFSLVRKFLLQHKDFTQNIKLMKTLLLSVINKEITAYIIARSSKIKSASTGSGVGRIRDIENSSSSSSTSSTNSSSDSMEFRPEIVAQINPPLMRVTERFYIHIGSQAVNVKFRAAK